MRIWIPIMLLFTSRAGALPRDFKFQNVSVPASLEALRTDARETDPNQLLRSLADARPELGWVVMRNLGPTGPITWRDPRVALVHGWYVDAFNRADTTERYVPAGTDGPFGPDRPRGDAAFGFVVDTDGRGVILATYAHHVIDRELAARSEDIAAIRRTIVTRGPPPDDAAARDRFAAENLMLYFAAVQGHQLARFAAYAFILEARRELGLSVANYRDLLPLATQSLLDADRVVGELSRTAEHLVRSSHLSRTARAAAHAFTFYLQGVTLQIQAENKALWSIACEVHLSDQPNSGRAR